MGFALRSCIVLGLLCVTTAAWSAGKSGAPRTVAKERASSVSVHYMEIVTSDVDGMIKLYSQAHGLKFGEADPDLGQARVATLEDGTLVGIRAPLAEHESPTMRTYLAVDDIAAAVKRAEEAGAMVAYPPTRQGKAGMFAIVIHDSVQHGFWQK